MSKRWQPSVLAHDQLSKKPDLPSSAPVLRKTPASRDWLTGDASDDDEKRTPPEAKPKIIATPLRAPEQRGDVDGQEIEHDEQSSDDDVAEPEEASAQRPELPPRLGADRPSSSTASAPSASDTAAPAKPERPRIVPGRVKAPSWLVDAVDSPTAAERLISPSSAHAGPLSPGGDITDASAAEQLDAAALSAQHQLEELLRGPSDAATPPAATPPVAAAAAAADDDEEASPVVPPAKVKAPAWDDDDDDEMHKLAQPMRAGPEKLVDVATSPIDDVAPRMTSLDVADAAPPPRPASIVAQRSQQFTASPVEPRRPTPIRPKKGEGLARWSASSNKAGDVKVGVDGAGADTKLGGVGSSRDSGTHRAFSRDSGVGGGMKPWEREAALSAAALHSSVVKNTALPPASTSLHTATSSSGDDGETDRFSGVSSLISRWQHNVESNAPGWGHVGNPRR